MDPTAIRRQARSIIIRVTLNTCWNANVAAQIALTLRTGVSSVILRNSLKEKKTTQVPGPGPPWGPPRQSPYSILSGMRIRHRFYHSFFSTQHSTIQKLSLKNALVRLSAVLAPKQSDDHTYTVGTCLLLVCFSIQSIFYRSKDGGDFVFHKPI